MCFQFYTLVVLKYCIGAELRHSVSQWCWQPRYLYSWKKQHFPCPPPNTQNQGCQKICRIRKSVYTEQPTTPTALNAKHEETLVTASVFSSQKAKRADGCLRKARFQKGPSTQKNAHPGPGGCSLKTVTLGRTCSIERQRVRERESEQVDVNRGHPGEDAVPGIHTAVYVSVVWTQGGR